MTLVDVGILSLRSDDGPEVMQGVTQRLYQMRFVTQHVHIWTLVTRVQAVTLSKQLHLLCP